METKKGEKIIIKGGFKFHFHKMTKDDTQLWKYFMNTCKCFF